GGHSLSSLSQDCFQKPFAELSGEQQIIIYTLHTHSRTWDNNTETHIMAVFASGENPCLRTIKVGSVVQDSTTKQPCNNCLLVFHSHHFQTALNRERATGKTMKYIPMAHTNPTMGMVYACYKGLKGLFSESTPILFHYVHHVLQGNFKDNTVFQGLVNAMVIAKDRELKGKGMQNFRAYLPKFNEFLSTMHTVSPQAYCMFSTHCKTQSIQSIL
ncbi:hypothetical protein C8R42DRAFT_591508, partial [Lentinula raphanica]